MIGNEIQFCYYEGDILADKRERKENTGLVVDAYTEVSGTVSGKTEVFLGFGEGKVGGRTESKRKYIVEHYSIWDKEKRYSKSYTHIYAWQLMSIIKYANSNQETNEEKQILQ